MKLFACLALLLVFCSCSNYNKIRKVKVHNTTVKVEKKTDRNQIEEPITASVNQLFEAPIVASASEFFEEDLIVSADSKGLECDTLFLKDGSVKLVQILKIKKNKISYYLCCEGCSLVREIAKSEIKEYHETEDYASLEVKYDFDESNGFPDYYLDEAQVSRNKSWKFTGIALLTVAIAAGLTIGFFTSAIGGVALLAGIIFGYIFYGFLWKHLYAAAISIRMHEYTRLDGKTTDYPIKKWNTAHMIIASLFGFFIPLIVVQVKLNKLKKKYIAEQFKLEND